MSARTGPALLVAIDTEGDNQWDAAARRNQTFHNIHALDRLHEFFVRHGVRPDLRRHLSRRPGPAVGSGAPGAARARDCEIGAHHHAWETPPCDRDDVDRHPYALWLPLDEVRRAVRVVDGRHR